MNKQEKIVLIKILEDWFEDWFEDFMFDKAVLVGKRTKTCFDNLIKKIKDL